MAMVEISILMGIYNCEKTLGEAIESIISQSMSNWELIMCDDGSTDRTYSVAEEYRSKFPEKIVLLKNSKNQGLNQTLNNCLKVARGRYIARMDGDDISLPLRLEKEYQFLESHPEYAIVSCPMIYFDENGEWGRGTEKGEVHKKDFVSGTPFCHAPCMVRKEAYDAVGGYSTDPRTLRAEDYDLWFRMYELGYRGFNLLEPLYKMRDDENAYHRRGKKYALNEAYVRCTGYKRLRLPISAYIYVVRPVIVSMLPKTMYMYLHHKKELAK